ncbi:MAG: alpha-hydroxy-acid oxidizing protein [Planctomycetaceae bacterium]|nr:alpha-hydroxy-acid oxidizing protein [Planctomycetaceae bacterium]
MNRRVFSQILAFGAGLFGAQARAGEGESKKSPMSSPAAPIPAQPDGYATAIDPAPVTVNDFIARAKAKLPPATFEYVTSGSEDEVTLRDNVEAFHRIKLLPPLLHGVSEADLSTTVLGQKIALPVLLAPVAGLRLYHPEGALASARASARAGTIFAASTSAFHSIEQIAEASEGPKWFQLYVPKDRAIALQMVRRAEAAGYKAIVVTVDLGERKDADLRNKFSVPRDILLQHLRDVGHKELQDNISYEDLTAFNLGCWAPSLSWEFFEWLRGQTKLPIVLKGVMTTEAARKAVQLGLNGIVVSNHGGRRIDTLPASIDVLRDCVDAAQDKIEVILDSGVRRGIDVVKAIALGAKAVMIGRPHAWALAAGGEAGVKRVLDIFRDELTNSMIACGCPSVDKITSEILKQ